MATLTTVAWPEVGIETIATQTGSVTCRVMTVGRNRNRNSPISGAATEMAERRHRRSRRPTITVGAARTTADGAMAVAADATGATTTIGPYCCRATNVKNSTCSEPATPASISASTKIFLLRQPVTKCRVTLHL